MGGEKVTIAFVRTNKIGVGVGAGRAVWENISSHNYGQFTEEFNVDGVDVVAICECTDGTTNDALVHVQVQT